ncbi:hypothetical protein DPMN_003033 [Dreissena polymorpha]|uniref:Uncharacterized protein n=1 Tax=Dreissena polymorpha TaxID=45954 RepID=A0A9D4MPV2_DREPO|nr:hypothetical protein DPMN_003033 [Dreissena polymorpha]
MGDRFMKHPELLNLTSTVDQHDLQQQPQPWTQVYEAIWALAAASAVGDRFMKQSGL